MGEINTKQDLEKFASSPVPGKQQQGGITPASMTPAPIGPKPLPPRINNLQDLQAFIKQPIAKYDVKTEETAFHQKQQKRQAWENEGKTAAELAPEPPPYHMIDWLGWLNNKWINATDKAADKWFADPVSQLQHRADELKHQARNPDIRPDEAQNLLTQAKDLEEAAVMEPMVHPEQQKDTWKHASAQTTRMAGRTLLYDLRDWYSPVMWALRGFGHAGELAGELGGTAGKAARPAFMVANAVVGGKFTYDQAVAGIQQIRNGDSAEGWSNIGGAVSIGFMTALGVAHAYPQMKEAEVRDQTIDRLEKLKRTLKQQPGFQDTGRILAETGVDLKLPQRITVDDVQQAIDHMKSLRQERTAQAQDRADQTIARAPQKTEPVEEPAYIEAPMLSPGDREAKYFSLEEARNRLEAERAVDQRENRRLEEDRVNREGEAKYRRQRAGQEPVVMDKRAVRFNNEAADANKTEYDRLGVELQSVAEQNMHDDVPMMLMSIDTEKSRGRELEQWKKNVLKMEARRRELLARTDPASLAPVRVDLMKGIAETIDLADRENSMRDTASKLREEAKAKTTAEEFERTQAEADEAQKRAEDLQTRREIAMAARAAQTSQRQIYPTNAPIDLTMGAPTEVILPDGRRLKAHYAIVPGDQVVTSHNPTTFEWNDDYQPRETQPRDYSTNDEARNGVVTGGERFEPERIHTDDPSPHNGPPVIRRDGLVLGGNGREMRRQRAYRFGNGETVYRHLRSKLGQFGFGSTMMEIERKPSLVRVLDEDPETFEELYRLGRDLNRTETMGFDPAEQAVTAGRAMSAEMLDWGAAQMDALGEDASLRDFMRARGPEIIERMVASGMIEPTKRAAYITREGEMSEAAKDLFEAAWLGKIVDNPELLKTTPKDVLRKLTRGIIGLVKAKSAGGFWDLSPEVKGALQLWKRVDSVREDLNEIGKKGDSLVDRYLRPENYENGSMLMDYGTGTAREIPHPTVEAIAKLLDKSQIDVRDGFIDYGNDAEGKQATLGPAPEPVDSFNRFIGNKVGIEVKPEEWATGETAQPVPEAKEEPATPEVREHVQAVPEHVQEVPPDLDVQPPQSSAGNLTADRLKAFLENHPGFGGISDEIVQAADILSRNAMGKSLDAFLQENVADFTQSRDLGGDSLSQDLSSLRDWLRRSGKKISVEQHGEQLGLFGEPEKVYLVRNSKRQEAMILQSELDKLKQEFPHLKISSDQGGLFDAPLDLGAPEDDEGPQGTLFQEHAPVWQLKSHAILGDDKLPAAQSGEQWAAMLKNRGIKADEMKWIGIDDFLKGKKKVSRQELQDFIRENQLQVKEIALDQSRYPAGSPRFDGAGDLVENPRPAKYEAHTLPGDKKNYTELLLTLPQTAEGKAVPSFREWLQNSDPEMFSQLEDQTTGDYDPIEALWDDSEAYHTREYHRQFSAEAQERSVTSDFHSSHFDQPNILAHVRFDERTDADGKRTLLVEEVQSDWHQKGKKVGYQGDPETFNEWRKKMYEASGIAVEDTPEERHIFESDTAYQRMRKGGVPDAPFKADWHELAMKRMLRYAAENGYDKIAWVTGEQTADRYNIAKRVSRVEYLPSEKMLRAFDLNGHFIFDKQVEPDKIADVIGKEPAKRLLDSSPGETGGGKPIHSIEGHDLKVGGDWAKNLYDKAIPNFMSKYGKKWGTKVGETKLLTHQPSEQSIARRTELGLKLHKDQDYERVHSVDITPEMKRSVMQGQPLFQAADATKKGATEFLADGRAVVHLFENADASTFLHEFFHVMRRHLQPEDLKVLEDWLKIKDNKWSRASEEKAARAFEYYHRERKSESLPEGIRAIFQKIQDAMRQIYDALRGSPLVKPSPEVSSLFDKWYGKGKLKALLGDAAHMEPPPGDAKGPSGAQVVAEMKEAIRDGRSNATLMGWAPGEIGNGKAAMEHARKQLEAAGWKWNTEQRQYEKDGWYAFLRSQGDLSSPIVQWNRLDDQAHEPRVIKPRAGKKSFVYRGATVRQEDGKFVVRRKGEGSVSFDTVIDAQKYLDRQAMGMPTPQAEKIKPAAKLEEPPLSPAERDGAELEAEGGRKTLATGLVRTKVFPDIDSAAAWATKNKKNIKSLQIFKLKDGRRVADFTPNNEKVLFQETDPMAIQREIGAIEKRMGSMLSDVERSRLGKRLQDLKSMRSGMTAAPIAAPSAGKVITLWTPEGERPIEGGQREIPAQSAKPIRGVSDGLTPVPEPPGTGSIYERPEPPAVSKTEPGTRRAVRASGEGRTGRTTPGVAGGEPRGSLPSVAPVRIAEPARAKKPPIYADSEWNSKVKLYKLPDNSPTPTVAISSDLARMLMGGQRELVESALSGLDRYNSFILAAQTGTGKTYMASAIIRHTLEQNPDAHILIKTPSRTLIDKEGGYKQVAGDFGVDVDDLPVEGTPTEPGVYAVTWAASLNREGIEKHPWDLVIADEIQEARRWFADSKRGLQMKEMSNNSKNVLYMSASPFHTALEIGHMDKLGLWQDEGYEQWAKQFGVYRDSEGNLAGGRAPMRLAKLREQLIERGQYTNIDRNMDGYHAHFGVVPMDSVTKQGLANIDKAMQLAENYWYQVNKPGKVRPTRAQAVTLKKRWLEAQRLPQAIELSKKLEKQGWKVLIFSENKKEFSELFEFLKEADEGTGGEISRLLPKFPSVTDKLKDNFGEDIGIFAGRQSAARDNEKTQFNDGTKKHVYATYGAGGVGVGFHDVTGRAPRAVIYLGPPWSGISFDQALGRPWRYGTKSNVHAYFLFSNSQPEMELVANKVAPRMESLRAMVSGVKFEDPVVKALRSIPESREALFDYEFGNEHAAEAGDFNKALDTSMVTSYAELPITDAKEAMNKGMKVPGGEGASKPGVIRLFQENEDEIVPDDLEAPELRRARSINIDIAQGFIDSGAAPGANAVARDLTPMERRKLADVIMLQAEGAARENPAGATQQVYTAWENGMKQVEALLSGDDGMKPPPTPGMKPAPEPKKPGVLKISDWYLFTNGRDVLREAAKSAGAPEVGEKLARAIPEYHVQSGNIAGPWVTKYWDIIKKNKISKGEHHVLFLAMAEKQKPRRWITNELQRVRSETPMNERIAKAADEIQDLFKSVFNRLQKDSIYTTVYDAESGQARRVYYAEQGFGSGYVPQRYDYDAVHTVVDPKTGETHKFTLRQLTEHDPGEVKREAIISGMMENHGLSRAQAEDWLGTRKRSTPLVGHVERAREADIPFFRTDPGAIVNYLEGAGELLARKQYFGQEGEKVAGLLAQIPDKKMRDISRGIMDSLLQRDPMAEEPKAWLRLAADWAVLTKMTFATIKVLGHPVHGRLLSNTRAFLGGLFEGTIGYRDAIRLADMAGSTLEQTKIEMLSEFGVNKKGLASKFLQANLWQTAYKWGRVVSDANARVYMGRYALPELIKHPDNARIRRQLSEFYLMDNARINAAIERRRWNEEDMAWGAKAFSDKVMFTNDPTELPPLWRARAGSDQPASDFGLSIIRASTLLKGYQFKTHALLKDAIYDEIKNHGNFRPLLPFLALYPMAGELIADLTALATLNKKRFQQMLDDDLWEPGQMLKRFVEDIAHQIGDSQLMAAIEAFVHGKPQLGTKITEEYFAGPIASDMLRGLYSAADIAFAKNERHRNKAVKSLVRETFPATAPIMNIIDPPPERRHSGGLTMAPAPPR